MQILLPMVVCFGNVAWAKSQFSHLWHGNNGHLKGLLDFLNRKECTCVCACLCVCPRMWVSVWSYCNIWHQQGLSNNNLSLWSSSCVWGGWAIVFKAFAKPFSTYGFHALCFHSTSLHVPSLADAVLGARDPAVNKMPGYCYWRLHPSQQLGLLTSQPFWPAPWCKISKIPNIPKIKQDRSEWSISKAIRRS